MTTLPLNNALHEWNLGETVIRKMTRLANEHGAVNLSQGFADFDTPEVIKEAARKAIGDGNNQYSYTYGIPPLREAIARRAAAFNGLDDIDPEDIVVTLGATEAIMSVLKTVGNPGDEVVFFEPFHEAYVPQVAVLGLQPRAVAIDTATMTFDIDALDAACTDRTVAMVLNTPHNPSGKVFTAEELQHIADLAKRRNFVVITDEIYEHIRYDEVQHISIASLPGMRERTFTCNAMSKTYAATGWRIGWTICPPEYTRYVRAIHDITVVQAPTPLQIAGVAALNMPDEYYDGLPGFYQERRDLLIAGLREVGFTCAAPAGSYYVMADFTGIDPNSNSTEFAMRLLTEAKVACVPGSNFYLTPGMGENEVRFAFCKRIETLQAAVANLRTFKP